MVVVSELFLIRLFVFSNATAMFRFRHGCTSVYSEVLNQFTIAHLAFSLSPKYMFKKNKMSD